MILVQLLLVAFFGLGEVSGKWQGFGRIQHNTGTEYKDDPKELILHRDQANNFRTSHGRTRRDLWEECYDEGCSKEEVEEVVEGHALHQYYYGWRCKQLYGKDWTYSYNPSRLQCCNCLVGNHICASGFRGYSRGWSRTCNFGHYRNIYAIYMENGCNDGELANWRLNFDDPSKSVRYVYSVGCREKKSFTTVRGARSYTATNIGGGGGDGRVSNYALGWFGYSSKFCGNPGSPSNGYKTGDNYYEMSKVYFYCHYGYTRVGNSYRTCRYWGWDGSVPSCKRICQPGYYSSTGHDPCSSCPIGQYQPNTRQTRCISCPSGKSTTKRASKFASDCHHKCSKVICTLGSWGQWSDMANPVGDQCASQSRIRVYQKRWEEVLDPSGCHNLPKTCPSDQTETRERDVYCQPLTPPQNGYYTPSACTTTRQKCKTPCIFYCNSEFTRQGSNSDFTRTCQANGQWSYSQATCKDVTPPTITCPASVTVNNDRRKATARVTLPLPTASDNTGIAPSVAISSPGIKAIHDFPITDVGSGTEVRYTATDEEGLSASCRFFVKVIDAEKPEVLSCPSSPQRVETTSNPKRVVYPEPTFKDNYDIDPSVLSSHVSGAQFPWGAYHLKFNATDKAGNKASCAYTLEVGPLKCKFWDAPLYGIRACTLQVNNVKQELLCTVQCKGGYEFVNPLAYHAYACKATGHWHGYKHFSFDFPGDKLAVDKKPWPDCAFKTTPTGVEKKLTVYAGSCLAGDEATQNQIKQNFIDRINQDPLLQSLLCLSNSGVDCKLSNVKVDCGKNSRRKRRSQDSNVIEVEYKVMDLNPTSNDYNERTKLLYFVQQIEGNKKVVEAAVKRAAAAATKVTENDIDIEEGDTIGACATGKVLVVKEGAEKDIFRSECVNCAAGTYYDMKSKTCVSCAIGMYQDEESQEFCKNCPTGTTTEGAGSNALDDCKGICRAGEYSANGLETCIACPAGTYQAANRSTACTSCPAGTSTLDVGTDSDEECKAFCTAGNYSPTQGMGACLPCPRGTYQPNGRATSCTPCTQGHTTLDEGATSGSQCQSHSCGMDFENGIGQWTKTGTVFNNQPTYGDNPVFRNRETSQLQGNYWIGGSENRPSSSDPAGSVQGDGPTGTLTSPSFRIGGSMISFLIGGGCNIMKERVELVVDGSVVLKNTGKCSETMERVTWYVSAYQNKNAQVRLVDDSSDGWGHINFDDLRGDFCI